MIGAIRKLLLIGVSKFIFDNRLTGWDEPRIWDDAELFHFGRQENARGRQQERVNTFQRIARIETFEVDGGGGDDLLSQFQLFAQHLN